MNVEIATDEHKAVGPYTDVFGHGPVTVIAPDGRSGHELVVCLDCGYTADDLRMFSFEECNREDNPINMTWRERIEKRGFADPEEDSA